MECGLPVRAPGSRARHIEIFSKLLLSMRESLQLLPSKLNVETEYLSDLPFMEIC